MATRPGEVALSESERAELDALRRGGYGPDGGLSVADADRLRALEERKLDAVVAEDPPTADSVMSATLTPASPAPAAISSEPDQGTSADAPTRRHPFLVAAAAVGAAALLVTVGWVLGRPPESVDAGSLAPVAVDQSRAEVVLGTASFAIRRLDPDTLVQYANLGQGTPWSAADAAGGRCLILTVTDDSPEMVATAGVWDVACAPAGLPAIVDWRVDESFPSPPQDLPDGSVVRLTLRDEGVGLSIGRPE